MEFIKNVLTGMLAICGVALAFYLMTLIPETIIGGAVVIIFVIVAGTVVILFFHTIGKSFRGGGSS